MTTVKRKAEMIRAKYHKDMSELLKECTNDYDRCIIFAEIGANLTNIVRDNFYVNQYIDTMLDNGYRHETIFFDEVYEWVNETFGDEASDEVAEYFATNNIRSIYLDW